MMYSEERKKQRHNRVDQMPYCCQLRYFKNIPNKRKDLPCLDLWHPLGAAQEGILPREHFAAILPSHLLAEANLFPKGPHTLHFWALYNCKSWQHVLWINFLIMFTNLSCVMWSWSSDLWVSGAEISRQFQFPWRFLLCGIPSVMVINSQLIPQKLFQFIF